MLSATEENYIKAIYHLSQDGKDDVATNTIADYLETSAASVTDMIKKLSVKKLLDYQRYRGVKITSKGKKEALKLIRKHRPGALNQQQAEFIFHFKPGQIHKKSKKTQNSKETKVEVKYNYIFKIN